MAYTIQIKKGQLNVEKALQNMDYDVVKFESELMMLAKHQSPRARSKLLNQYVKYMRGCGFKLTVRGIGKTKVSAPAQEPTPKHTQKPTVKATTETTQEATPEPKIEVAPQIAKQEIKVPEPVPQPMSTATGKQKPETTPNYDEPYKEAIALMGDQTPIEPEKIETETPRTEAPVEAPKTDEKEAPKSTYAEVAFSVGNAVMLKKLFETIGRAIKPDDPTFEVTADALSIRQMDPGRVTMVDYHIGKEYFESWSVQKPGRISFSVETVLKTAFKQVKKDTRVTVTTKDYKIAFAFEEGRTRKTSFPLLDPSEESVPTPKISFNANAKFDAKPWAEAMQELDRVSDHVTITINNDAVQMSAIGDMASSIQIYNKGNCGLIDVEAKEESKAVFSLGYLADTHRVDSAFCSVLRIDLSTEMPIRLAMQTPFGELIGFVAPRIECE